MKISDIGGEFELIKRLTLKKNHDVNIIKGIGDDCAVLRFTKEKHLLITTDMMVENDHFNLKWYKPSQVGRKLMEVNVSDIVAMGGVPKYAFLSMSVLSDTQVEFMENFYKGLYASASRHGVLLLGGDTTHGTEYVFNLALTGEVEPSLLRLRSKAKPGDIVCVTGTLGKSTAGLNLLLNGIEGHTKDHIEPKSRTAAEGKAIAGCANAMIDVSDGLGSEVVHICGESHTGACIFYDDIPLSRETVESAGILGLDPYDFALYGGEDFELVFTIQKENIKKLKMVFTDFTEVGRVLREEEGIFILKEGKKLPVKKGYDHFD
jgi:thiamine-monophosphate kinase